MEVEQIENRLEWLDEQRRKEADTIARLNERLSSIEADFAKVTKQSQELSSELTRLSTIAGRIKQVDETLAKHRKDVSRQLKESEKRRTEKENVLEDLRKSDQKGFAKALDDVRNELSAFGELQEILETRRKEELRITKDLDGQKKSLEDLFSKDEDRSLMIASFEEGRKQDAKRVADLQAETSDLRSRTDKLRGELDTAEDRIRRLEVNVSELSASEGERKEAQALWFEQQNMKWVEFERKWREWEKRFDDFEQRGGELTERMLSYEETYRNLTQLKSDLDDVIERLERRINELTEMHRLNADRLKQEWNTFQADDQKRWNTYKLTSDEQWREHGRLHEKMASQLEIHDENAADALSRLNQIQDMDRQRLMTFLAMFREWAAEYES